MTIKALHTTTHPAYDMIYFVGEGRYPFPLAVCSRCKGLVAMMDLGEHHRKMHDPMKRNKTWS